MEAQKTRVGRVVYLSEDACQALTVWLNQRDPAKERLFYGQGRPALELHRGPSEVRQISGDRPDWRIRAIVCIVSGTPVPPSC